MLSHLPHNSSCHNSDDRGDISDPVITDQTFLQSISLIVVILILKIMQQYDQQIQNK